ncbi:MAG: bifunctional DNA-binding transcriptional regulator/O6-methylguanine-DNA methyltransferase Ada [Anaerolineae bacterium]|nr:bifunctional DNA-binding transcriptional regulator/O6-methylguanine-DNA methyltransferase Ada [Anaerolineae bacterium]
METFLDENTRWRALESRDARFDGLLYYGVRSTGVYCRPSCPSRRPARPQVIFFSSCDEAETAGFRPCLRCRPGQPLRPHPQVDLVAKACRLIEIAEAPLSLGELSRQLGVSPFQLHRAFKAVMGVTPRQYSELRRIRQFKDQVRQGGGVATALYEAGYGSSSRLYEKASDWLGMTPASYRNGGKNMEIQYAIVETYLGRMLVAATRRGVCAVSFGEEDDQLKAALRSEYPRAEIRQAEAGLREWVDALLEHLNGQRPRLDLPLDVQATAFQLRVWEELRKIPRGQTRSYSQVAQAIGQPKAVRAVARACASNPAALVNPCHRVLRSDGGLGGYRWGLARKEALLAHERLDGE